MVIVAAVSISVFVGIEIGKDQVTPEKRAEHCDTTRPYQGALICAGTHSIIVPAGVDSLYYDSNTDTITFIFRGRQ